jgi:uncharacterized membrane protein
MKIAIITTILAVIAIAVAAHKVFTDEYGEQPWTTEQSAALGIAIIIVQAVGTLVVTAYRVHRNDEEEREP